MFAGCRETKGGAGPAPATAVSPQSEPAPTPAEPVAPPSAESSTPLEEAADPEQVEADAWSNARVRNTVLSYQRYLESYPDGRFAPRAKKRIASLRRDDTAFLAAEKKGTLQAAV
jgi:hypothetical protein